MNIYLVRHADYNKNYGFLKGRLPVKLSEIGIMQAEKLRDYFRGLEIDAIYSSAVMRCKQTSEIIANDTHTIQFDQRLLEALVPYQGYMDGTWATDAYTHQQELGGETIQDVHDRIVNFYKDLIEKDLNNVIVCSHGDPLFFLYVHLLKGELSDDYNALREKYTDYQSKASIRLIKTENKNVKEIKIILKQEELND